MKDILTSEFPERSGKNLNAAKMRIVNEEGLQEYLNSYECYLNTQWLRHHEIQKEMNRVRWSTIYEMQKNYKYN
jgi:dsRNA-specific ribonuclease